MGPNFAALDVPSLRRDQAFARTAIYTNSPLSAGNRILAMHIQELRDYVK
jgi:hypothetical protein